MPRKRSSSKRANGEGTLVQRLAKDGKTVTGWKAAVTVGYKPDGKPDRRWISGKSQEAVREKAEALKTARNGGTLFNTEGVTLEVYARFWLENKPKAVRTITRESYTHTLEKHLFPELGRLKLEKLTGAHLDGLYRKKLKDGLSTRVCRYVHTLVHGMLAQAVKWDKLPRNVADAATPPSLKTKKMEVWTPKDAVQFLDFAQQDRLHAAWYLALFGGLRRGELVGLRWQDVNLEQAQVTVNQTLVAVKGKLEVSEPKTESSKRTISISLDTVAVLQAHLERQNLERERCGEIWHTTGYVFTTNIGTPINPANFGHAYKRVVRAAGVPDIRLHDLRHTSASLAIKRGDSPKVVSERLGHNNVAFTLNNYVKTYGSQRREAALGIADLFPRDTSQPN